MPRGSKPGENNGGGRKPGSLNKATLERLAIAERETREAQASGKKLAKEVLDEFMHLFAGMAAYHQPTPPNSAQVNTNADEPKFEKYAVLAVDCARMLAPYQSPTFKAIAVHVVPDQNQGKLALPAPLTGGNVVAIDDPASAMRVYKRMIATVR